MNKTRAYKEVSFMKTKRLVALSLLVAVVVALQVIATFIQPASFSITLTLIPIVVGAAVYGRAAGAVLGATFGFVVLIMSLNGADVGGHMLWAVRPLLTAVLCVFKGAAAGYCAGLVYSLLSKKSKSAGVFSAAFICPIVNTGIFIAAMALFYRDMLTLWAGDSPLLYFSFIGLAGVNFLIELGLNIVLAPAALRVIHAVGSRPRNA
jgi:uncharacterized membrane protein